MSANKFKYFTVYNATTVRALNKSDALAITQGDENVPGDIVQSFSSVERVAAREVQNATLTA